MDNLVRNILMDEILNDPVDDLENLVHQFPINEINNILDGIEDFIVAFEDDLNGGFQINPRNDGPVAIWNYFEEVIPQYDNDQFHSHFRMSLECIIELENVIRPHTLDTNDGIPLQKKILLAIWILATPDSFRSVADRFELPTSVAHVAAKEVITILANMLREYLHWPAANECEAIEAAFSLRRGFPGVIGAIDECHIEIIQPPGNANDYYNRKETHSIILQGTCDNTGKFIDVLVGRSGREHDSAVFRSSTLCTLLTNVENSLLPPNHHILGDSAYLLMMNILTPFKDKVKSKVKSIQMANLMVSAACTLHNFILIHNGNIKDYQRVNHDHNAENEMEEEAEVDEDNVDVKAVQKRNNVMNSM